MTICANIRFALLFGWHRSSFSISAFGCGHLEIRLLLLLVKKHFFLIRGWRQCRLLTIVGTAYVTIQVVRFYATILYSSTGFQERRSQLANGLDIFCRPSKDVGIMPAHPIYHSVHRTLTPVRHKNGSQYPIMRASSIHNISRLRFIHWFLWQVQRRSSHCKGACENQSCLYLWLWKTREGTAYVNEAFVHAFWRLARAWKITLQKNTKNEFERC